MQIISFALKKRETPLPDIYGKYKGQYTDLFDAFNIVYGDMKIEKR